MGVTTLNIKRDFRKEKKISWRNNTSSFQTHAFQCESWWV